MASTLDPCRPSAYARGITQRLCATLLATIAVLLVAATTTRLQAADESSPVDLFIKSYVDEWGKPPKTDPNAPPSRWPTSLLPPQPETIPPYPFTEWPFGGASAIGATLPNTQGGALMKALAPTDFGKWLKDSHIEIYGWINGGGNISTATNPYKSATMIGTVNSMSGAPAVSITPLDDGCGDIDLGCGRHEDQLIMDAEEHLGATEFALRAMAV